MRIYLTMFIVSLINWIVAEVSYRTNIITQDEIIDFMQLDDDEEDGGMSSSVILLLAILVPFVNILATTSFNMMLIMAKQHSRNKNKK